MLQQPEEQNDEAKDGGGSPATVHDLSKYDARLVQHQDSLERLRVDVDVILEKLSASKKATLKLMKDEQLNSDQEDLISRIAKFEEEHNSEKGFDDQ